MCDDVEHPAAECEGSEDGVGGTLMFQIKRERGVIPLVVVVVVVVDHGVVPILVVMHLHLHHVLKLSLALVVTMLTLLATVV